MLEKLLDAFRAVASSSVGSSFEQAAADDVKALEGFLAEREQAAAAAVEAAEHRAVAWFTAKVHPEAGQPVA